PISEESVAATLVEIIKKMPTEQSGTEFDQLTAVPILLKEGESAARNYLSRARNQSEKADFYISMIKNSVAQGVKPAFGGKTLPNGVRQEGWTGNACYFAHLLPAYIRVFDFFDLPYPREQYQRALDRFSDFTTELLGGKPFDLEKWRTTLEEQ